MSSSLDVLANFWIHCIVYPLKMLIFVLKLVLLRSMVHDYNYKVLILDKHVSSSSCNSRAQLYYMRHI